MSRPVILFVDDEKLVLDSLVAQVRAAYENAYDYETAQSAEEAWEIIEDYHDRQRRIVLLVSDEEAILRAERYANLFAFIRKPWEREVLLSTIQKALSGSL
jgi:peptidyl-tRNA hydrolase